MITLLEGRLCAPPRPTSAGAHPWLATSILVLVATCALPTPASAQELFGRIIDAENGAPVGLAAIFVLDADREPVVAGAADVQGNYRIELPAVGEYYLIAERLGYFENETPLFAVEGRREYGIDMEMRPEPFRLDPLEVTVQNEKLEDFLQLTFGVHPNSIPGYRSIQGVRLEEAKSKSRDNTDLLRWLYIPVSHGREVCVGTVRSSLPARTSADRTNARADAAAAPPDLQGQCGALYVNDRPCRLEHIEEIDRDRIGVVVTVRGAVHMYTRDFDWTFRSSGEPGC